MKIYTPNTSIHDCSLSWLGAGTSMKIYTPNTSIHDCSLSWLGAGTSMNIYRVKNNN
jgi:hypothetical protein